MSGLQGAVTTEVFQYFNNRNGRASGYSLTGNPGFREMNTDRQKLPLYPGAQAWCCFFLTVESIRIVQSPGS